MDCTLHCGQCNMSWSRNTQSPELAIAIPHEDEVSFDWMSRFISLELPPHRLCAKSTAPIDLAREESVEMALSSGAEWILFLDSDVLPPVDVFQKLRRHDLDVVSGVYMTRKDDGHPAMWLLDENEELSPIQDYRKNTIVEVDAVGLGCVLVNTRVLKAMDRPWFKWTKGFENHPWDTRSSDGQQGVGEDFYFFHKVREAGFNVYVDTSVECGHENRVALADGKAYNMSEYMER